MTKDSADPFAGLDSKELIDELEARGDMPAADLDNFSSHDLIEELEERDALPEAEAPSRLPEILDLIAEAARTSRHARAAYQLLRDAFPDAAPGLQQTLRLIEGRMGGLPC